MPSPREDHYEELDYEVSWNSEGDDCEGLEDEESSNVDFYEEVLRDMRSRRRASKERNSKLMEGGDSMEDLTESTSSMHSFLSWASASASSSNEEGLLQPQSQYSHSDEQQYWRELVHNGRAPAPSFKERNSDAGSLPELIAKLTRSSATSSSGNLMEQSFVRHGSASFSGSGSSNGGNITATSNMHQSCVDFGAYHESARQLQYSRDDLQQLAFACDGRDFHKLQKSLRREGAITNELLKQVLHVVVVQSQQKRRARQQQALAKILEMEPEQSTDNKGKVSDSARGNNSKSPVRAKSPLHQAFSFLIVEEKKED